MVDLWVLTVAPGSRAAEAEEMFKSLDIPPDRRVLVTNPPDEVPHFPGYLIHYPSSELNISKWWDAGLNHIAKFYDDGEQWDVLLIETDARMRIEGVATLRRIMRETDTVMAGGDWRNVLSPDSPPHVRRDNTAWVPDPEHPDAGRIPGIACVVAGEAGIRHDHEFRWWLADDDFEWQHRVGGGTVLVPGVEVWHTGTQGPLTGLRLQYWEEDQHKFYEKWGGMPGTGGIVS